MYMQQNQPQNPMAAEPVPGLLARLLGLGDKERANAAVGSAQLLALVISVVFMLFSAACAMPSHRWWRSITGCAAARGCSRASAGAWATRLG